MKNEFLYHKWSEDKQEDDSNVLSVSHVPFFRVLWLFLIHFLAESSKII
jgi:hypothetical protein